MSEPNEAIKKALEAVKESPALQLTLLKVAQYHDFITLVANENETVRDRLISIIRECCEEGDKLGVSRAAARQGYGPPKEPRFNKFAPPIEDKDEEEVNETKQLGDIPTLVEETKGERE